jgi:hypothetical protein
MGSESAKLLNHSVGSGDVPAQLLAALATYDADQLPCVNHEHLRDLMFVHFGDYFVDRCVFIDADDLPGHHRVDPQCFHSLACELIFVPSLQHSSQNSAGH